MKRVVKCAHPKARAITSFDRSLFEETAVGVLWCPACGALGSLRYTDGETIRWALPGG